MPKSHRRKAVLGCLMSAAVVGCTQQKPVVTAEQRPVARTGPPAIEQFIKIRWPRSATLAANGNLYYIDLVDGISQLFRQAPGRDHGTPITDFHDGIGGYTVSDDGRWIAITAAVGGDEQYDIHLMDTATETIKPILVDRETVFGSVVWSRDSSEFAYRANKNSKADFNIYTYNVSTGDSSLVFEDPGYWYPVDFPKSAMKLALGHYVSASESSIHEVSLLSYGSRPIVWVDGTWSFDPVGYIANDEKFLAVTDYQGDRKRLFEIELRSARLHPVLTELNDHEVDYAVLNEQRDRLAVVVNEDGYASLHLYSLPDYKPVPGPDLPKGIVGNVRLTGRTLLYTVNNANTPGLLYRWDLDQPAEPPVRLTEADTQGIDVSTFSLPELIKFESFDGLEVPAFLYLPSNYKPGTPIPFIVSYHGGPEGQYRPYFARHFQYFLSRGFGVLAPNVRGSSGYGRNYLELDNYKKRMNSVRDGVAAARWLIDNGYSKPKMIGAFGGSYGGFMVMAVITQAPEIFGAACDVVGIVNFETFLQRTKAYRRKLREAEYGPLSDPEFLRTISPIYLVDRIKTPLFIAHGENDPRVPIHEARQLYQKLKELGQDPELLVFDDEGHGFRKEPNRIIFYKKLADFFENHLRPSS